MDGQLCDDSGEVVHSRHLVLVEECLPRSSQSWMLEPTAHPQKRLQHLRQQIRLPSLLVELDNHVEVVLDVVFAPNFRPRQSHHRWLMTGA